jgi:hypothetical protein
MVAQEELGGAEIVGGPKKTFTGTDILAPVPGLQGEAEHPLGGGLPFPMPRRLITLGNGARGDDHLTKLSAAVVGEPGGAQRLERERLVVEEEFHN